MLLGISFDLDCGLIRPIMGAATFSGRLRKMYPHTAVVALSMLCFFGVTVQIMFSALSNPSFDLLQFVQSLLSGTSFFAGGTVALVF